MPIASVTDRTFGREVLQQESPVVVAFRAGWCLPSQQLAPLVDEVADRYDGQVKVVTVDVDDDPKANKICLQYNVSRLPVVMLFRDGRVVDFIGGATTPDTVTDMVEKQLRPVLEVNEYTFDAEVLTAKTPVLVHVYADWCQQSLTLEPVVEAAARRFQGRAKVVRLEFGPANARLCAQYQFLRVPVLALFNRGRLEDQILGEMEGGTKTEAVRVSCIGQTTTDNVNAMVEQFVL